MRRLMLLLCFATALILGIGSRPARAWAQDVPDKPPEAAPPPAEPPPDQKDKAKSPAAAAAAAADDGEEEIENEPVTMKVGVRFKSLNKLDLSVGTFQSEVVVRVACDREPCKPHLEIVNGAGKPEKIEDSKLVKMYKYKADLNALIDTSAMPFDVHLLPLVLEDRKNLDVKFEIDDQHSSVDDDVKLPGFDLLEGATATQTEDLGDGKQKQQAHFGILVRRNRFSAFMNYLFPPLIMAMFVMGATLFTKPKAAAGRLAGTAGGLLAVVMFHKGALPPGGVTTLFDKFMIATYLAYVLNIVFTVIMLRAEDNKNEAAAELAYLTAWGAVPGFALVAWLAVFLRLV